MKRLSLATEYAELLAYTRRLKPANPFTHVEYLMIMMMMMMSNVRDRRDVKIKQLRRMSIHTLWPVACGRDERSVSKMGTERTRGLTERRRQVTE